MDQIVFGLLSRNQPAKVTFGTGAMFACGWLFLFHALCFFIFCPGLEIRFIAPTFGSEVSQIYRC